MGEISGKKSVSKSVSAFFGAFEKRFSVEKRFFVYTSIIYNDYDVIIIINFYFYIYKAMNPAGIRTQNEAMQIRQEYINNLRLQAGNLQKTKNALETLEKTGETPSRPAHTRTQEEQYADIQQIKIDLRQKLTEIMDGTNATHVLHELSHNPAELYYVANRISDLAGKFKTKYELGTPAIVFLSTIRQMMKRRAKETAKDLGFSSGAKEDSSKGNPPKPAGGSEDTDNNEDDDGNNEPKQKKERKSAKSGVDKEASAEKRAIKKETADKTKRQEKIDEQRAQLPEPVEIKVEPKRESSKKGVNKEKATEKRQKKAMETRSDARKKIIEEKRAKMPTNRKRLREKDEDIDESQPKRPREGDYNEIPKPIDEPTNLSAEQMKKALLNHMNEKNKTKIEDPSVKSGFRYKSQINKMKTEALLRKLYERHIKTAGSGFKTTKKPSKNIIFGSGIKVHHRNVTLDTNKAIIPKETYSQFGRYIINNHRLNDDVIMLRSKKGAVIPYIPTQKVSKNLIKCVSKIVNGGNLDYKDINQLNEEEKEHLHTIINKSQLADKFKIPQNCKIDEENHRFEVLKGEILAGNNSPKAIKEFKLLIVKLMNNNRLPRRQGVEILTDLTTLGF